METRSTPIAPPTLNRPTVFGQEDRLEVVGLKRDLFSDAYNLLLEASWSRLVLGFVAMVLIANLIFGLGFFAIGGVANVRPGLFRDDFYFSVQTLGSIGYGQMYPVSDAAEFLVLLESIAGIFMLALTTGLIFAKFSLPVARVAFSKTVVVSSVDGVPTLQFRAANTRGNHVVAAEASIVLIRWEQTAEGRALYRMHDLPLVRSRSPAFRNTWLLMHRITPDSPLHGLTLERAIELDLELAVTLMGMDGTTSQTLHAHHSYVAEDLRFGEVFADMLADLPGGGLRVDYGNFDVTKPAA